MGACIPNKSTDLSSKVIFCQNDHAMKYRNIKASQYTCSKCHSDIK